MRKFFYITIILFFSIRANAQFVNNKLNLELGFGLQSILGNKDYLDNFSAEPFLIGEKLNSGSICLGINYNFNSFLSAGINLNYFSFNSFSYTGELHIFNSEKISILTLKPNIQFYIPHQNFKDVNFSLVLAPTYNKIMTIFSHEYSMLVMDGSSSGVNQIQYHEWNAYYFGVDFGLKIGLDINNFYGLYTKAGYNRIFISSSNFSDTGISNLYIQFGLDIRLFLNKTYNY